MYLDELFSISRVCFKCFLQLFQINLWAWNSVNTNFWLSSSFNFCNCSSWTICDIILVISSNLVFYAVFTNYKWLVFSFPIKSYFNRVMEQRWAFCIRDPSDLVFCWPKLVLKWQLQWSSQIFLDFSPFTAEQKFNSSFKKTLNLLKPWFAQSFFF